MIKEIKEHRTIRSYNPDPIPQDVMNEILIAGTRASNTGNMQVYSIIVTTSKELLTELAPLHFNQSSVREAPALVTFCADINRFNKWCRQRGATPGYDNFMWFMSATVDAMLASQNMALEAEAHGLGICYLGTALYNAEKIGEVLKLPQGVVPVMAMTIGYPATLPPLTERLPVEAVVHYDTYHDYTEEQIDRIWAERETNEETKRLLEENNLPNLARIFTERRYTEKENRHFSRTYFEYLVKQGFFNQ